VAGNAELAHDKDIERRLKPLSHLKGHRYTPAWQAKHKHAILTGMAAQLRGQLTPGVRSISE
jgi:hypothetical protein